MHSLLGCPGRGAAHPLCLFAAPAGTRRAPAPALVARPRDRYRADADMFPYARPPPPGFERWLAYARPRQCVLGRYDRLEADLAPFLRAGRGGSAGRPITRASLAAAAALPHTVRFSVRRGRVSFEAPEALAALAREYLVVLDAIGPHLPDTDFVVNTLDTPRVRSAWGPGPRAPAGAPSPARRAKRACSRAFTMLPTAGLVLRSWCGRAPAVLMRAWGCRIERSS